MPGGVVLGPLFYVLVAFAALTSTISLGEVVAAYLIDERGWSRPKATVISGAVLFAMTILAALSFGAVGPLSGFEIFDNKRGVFSTLDHLASNWMLPLGGLATTIFVGWFLGKRASLEELGLQRETMAYKVWLWLIRIVAPAAIAALLIAVALGTDFS
jgi:NSS family neurotransmitter:Na+ symporter